VKLPWSYRSTIYNLFNRRRIVVEYREEDKIGAGSVMEEKVRDIEIKL
jgi:hypothetical protein